MPNENLDNEYAKKFVLACRAEAESAKRTRMDLNKDNFAMYNLEHDFSHKNAGQSKEVLAKTRNATEQNKAFFQQSLADLADWFRIELREGVNAQSIIVTADEAQKLLNFMLERADYFSHVGNSAQSGLLGSLAISKICGKMIPKPKYVTRKSGKGKNYEKRVVKIEDKTWELRFAIIRQENYYPDPHASDGNKLYEVEDCFLDLHVVKQLSQGDDAIFEASAVNELKPWNGDEKDESKKRETGQNTPTGGGMRPRVKLTEFWGTVVDENTGEVMCENCVITLANDDVVIRAPTDNPLWHQKSPIVAAALIEVANSVWGVALMDAGTKHNRSLIEIFNLILDSAMKAVWGISQTRVDVLEDVSQIQDGLKWGTNLKVNSNLPIGGKAMEEVVTGQIPAEVISVYNMLMQETTTAMFSSDLRLGMQSARDVKATQVVATENSITGVFQGLAKNFEQKKIQPELELAWMEVAQNWDRIDREVFISLFGRERGEALAALEPQEVFVQTVNGYKFKVFGISVALRRQADFRKWTTLLQVVGANDILVEAFLQKYSFEKFLGEIMTAIDIDKSKISNTPPSNAGAVSATPEASALEQSGGAPGASPNQMSQVPAPSGPVNPLAAAFAANQMNMPSAQAVR